MMNQRRTMINGHVVGEAMADKMSRYQVSIMIERELRSSVDRSIAHDVVAAMNRRRITIMSYRRDLLRTGVSALALTGDWSLAR